MPDRAVPEIVTGDITTLNVDAIVNAANDRLAPGGGVCGAIHRAAGPQLARACAELASCPTGQARITPGFDLQARHVIHAVGPIYRDGHQNEADLLASCYRSSLQLARDHGVNSIAFPCISTGIYGYPLEAAARIALTVMAQWLAGTEPPRRIVCCCFSMRDAEVYRRLAST